MEHPATGIIRVERDRYPAHRWHQNSIANRATHFAIVDRHHLKRMAMQMYRVRHHRVVLHVDYDTLAPLDHQHVRVRPGPIVGSVSDRAIEID